MVNQVFRMASVIRAVMWVSPTYELRSDGAANIAKTAGLSMLGIGADSTTSLKSSTSVGKSTRISRITE